MKLNGSFSISVVRRLLKLLVEHGAGLNRTNLAGKAGLNYGSCVRYVDLLVLLRWVTLSQVNGNLVYITRSGREFIGLLERTADGQLNFAENKLIDMLNNAGRNMSRSPKVQTDSVLDRHRKSDFASHFRKDISEHGDRAPAIMIIEDELDVLLTYEVLLTQQGFNVYAFSDPRQALSEFVKNNHNIDLVISDIRMKSINGIQLYRELKAIAPDTKIIFISALDAAPELASALPGFKIENLIAKPVDQAKLTKTIQAALGKASHTLEAGLKQQTYN